MSHLPTSLLVCQLNLRLSQLNFGFLILALPHQIVDSFELLRQFAALADFATQQTENLGYVTSLIEFFIPSKKINQNILLTSCPTHWWWLLDFRYFWEISWEFILTIADCSPQLIQTSTEISFFGCHYITEYSVLINYQPVVEFNDPYSERLMLFCKGSHNKGV